MASSKSAKQFDIFLDEKYIPLENKIKTGIVIAAVVIPTALFFFLFYQPGFENISQLNEKIDSARAELTKAKKAARKLPKYIAEVENTELKFEEAAIVLPKTKEIPNLLRNISDLGKGAGLDFLSFKPGSEDLKDFYAEIPVNITIRGPYHNMGFFLDQVSELDRIVAVNNIDMTSPEEEKGEMLLNSTCRLVTYRFTNAPLEEQTTDKNDKNKKK